MARREAVPVAPVPYLYQPDPHNPDPARRTRMALQACENPANATHGLHLALVKSWPPKRTHAGEPVPFVEAICARCGCNMHVYADNNPDQSSIEVEVLPPVVKKTG